MDGEKLNRLRELGHRIVGQPSHLLAELGLHLGTCAGSQGMSERSWARLSRQCVPIRANLTADTKAKLMQLATNWSLLYPDVFLKWQKKKKSRKRKYCCDFVVLPRPAGRRDSGPVRPEAEAENQPAEDDGLDESISSSSTSNSDSNSNAGLAQSDNEWGEKRQIWRQNHTTTHVVDGQNPTPVEVSILSHYLQGSHGAEFFPSTINSRRPSECFLRPHEYASNPCRAVDQQVSMIWSKMTFSHIWFFQMLFAT